MDMLMIFENWTEIYISDLAQDFHLYNGPESWDFSRMIPTQWLNHAAWFMHNQLHLYFIVQSLRITLISGTGKWQENEFVSCSRKILHHMWPSFVFCHKMKIFHFQSRIVHWTILNGYCVSYIFVLILSGVVLFVKTNFQGYHWHKISFSLAIWFRLGLV